MAKKTSRQIISFQESFLLLHKNPFRIIVHPLIVLRPQDAPFAEWATFLGLMLVFRANMSYRRYWEVRSLRNSCSLSNSLAKQRKRVVRVGLLQEDLSRILFF